MKGILYLLLISLLGLIKSSKPVKSPDCSTAIECYAKAIDLLNTARKEYYDAKDKLNQVVETLQKYTDDKIAEDRARLSQLEQNFANLNSKVDSNHQSVNSRVDDLNWRTHNHNCRGVSTGCAEDGGGNAVFLDRHTIACGANEMLKHFQLVRCDNGRGIYYSYYCCSFP